MTVVVRKDNSVIITIEDPLPSEQNLITMAERLQSRDFERIFKNFKQPEKPSTQLPAVSSIGDLADFEVVEEEDTDAPF